ncbi:MAG TPA: hypothetical protein VFW65_08005 [Pseudonocardiaceae bacterium]|nr:hypothetical protein [Pseudonocardiaceae bacterium]
MARDPLWKPTCHVIEAPTTAQRRRAAHAVAAHARDAADLAELLDMLGLSAADLRAPDPAHGEPEPAVPSGPPLDLLAELAALRQWLVSHDGHLLAVARL